MNGTIYNVARLVKATKRALLNSDFSYELEKYVHSITFRFLDKKTFIGKQEITEYFPRKWFERMKKSGVEHIFILINTQNKEFQFAGFVEANRTIMVTIYRNGKVTFWEPKWDYDSVLEVWNIYYTEHDWTNPPKELPLFENPLQDFKNSLKNIKVLSQKLMGQKTFTNIFNDAYQVLDGGKIPDGEYLLDLQSLILNADDEKYRLIVAASMSDVFGGMGSWNDDPAGMAQEKGCYDEYNNLSEDLFCQIARAIMYAVN